MDREEAKLLIAQLLIPSLHDEEVSGILSEYWQYENIEEIKADIKSQKLPVLEDQAILIMATDDVPSHPDKKLWEPLIVDFLVFDLMYSSNTYLEYKLVKLGQSKFVQGNIEAAGKCPCCCHLSIDPGDEGLWGICPVCFWENGGDGPNKISLNSAQKNFELFGAKNEASLEFVDPDGIKKYPKSA